MTTYNIVSPGSMVAGQPEDISAVLANLTAIAAVLNGGLDNSNINAAAAIALSKLAGYPADATKFARGDGSWAVPVTFTPVTYRKTTAKTVNTTVAATDLLNGEITIGAGVMGATGMSRLTAFGDMLNNSGGSVSPPRFQLVFGGTTIFDTNALSANWVTAATRFPWLVRVTIFNTATGAQVAFIELTGASNVGASNQVTFTTGEGSYSALPGSQLYGQGYNTSAVDTTAAKALVLNVINGSASASCETKLTGALVEVV